MAPLAAQVYRSLRFAPVQAAINQVTQQRQNYNNRIGGEGYNATINDLVEDAQLQQRENLIAGHDAAYLGRAQAAWDKYRNLLLSLLDASHKPGEDIANIFKAAMAVVVHPIAYANNVRVGAVRNFRITYNPILALQNA